MNTPLDFNLLICFLKSSYKSTIGLAFPLFSYLFVSLLWLFFVLFSLFSFFPPFFFSSQLCGSLLYSLSPSSSISVFFIGPAGLFLCSYQSDKHNKQLHNCVSSGPLCCGCCKGFQVRAWSELTVEQFYANVAHNWFWGKAWTVLLAVQSLCFVQVCMQYTVHAIYSHDGMLSHSFITGRNFQLSPRPRCWNAKDKTLQFSTHLACQQLLSSRRRLGVPLKVSSISRPATGFQRARHKKDRRTGLKKAGCEKKDNQLK